MVAKTWGVAVRDLQDSSPARTQANFKGLEIGLKIWLKFRVRLESLLESGHVCAYVLLLTHQNYSKEENWLLINILECSLEMPGLELRTWIFVSGLEAWLEFSCEDSWQDSNFRKRTRQISSCSVIWLDQLAFFSFEQFSTSHRLQNSMHSSSFILVVSFVSALTCCALVA